MARHRNYRVWQHAHQQLIEIGRITEDMRFGDLSQQLRRAGISVVSNIAEGAGRGSDAEFARFLRIARASNDEIAAQLDIASAIGGLEVAPILAANDGIGKMLTALIRRLRGENE